MDIPGRFVLVVARPCLSKDVLVSWEVTLPILIMCVEGRCSEEEKHGTVPGISASRTIETAVGHLHHRAEW